MKKDSTENKNERKDLTLWKKPPKSYSLVIARGVNEDDQGSKEIDLTGKKLSSYKLGKYIYARNATYWDLKSLYHVLGVVQKDGKEFALPGQLINKPKLCRDGKPAAIRRLKLQNGKAAPTLKESRDPLLVFDIDELHLPGYSPLTDTLEAVSRAVMCLLGPVFEEVSFIAQYTSGQKPDGDIFRMRFYLLADQAYPLAKRRVMVKYLAATTGLPLDASVTVETQPIYIANPIVRLEPGDKNRWPDILPERMILVRGTRERVTLPGEWFDMETVQETIGRAITGSGYEWPEDGDHLGQIGDHDEGQGVHVPVTAYIYHTVLNQGKRVADEAIVAALLARRKQAYFEPKKHPAHYLNQEFNPLVLKRDIQRVRKKLDIFPMLGTTVAPEFPWNPVPVAEAEAILTRNINVILHGDHPWKVLINTPAGGGKTRVIIEEVLDERVDILYQQEPINFFGPDHAQLDEMITRITNKGGNPLHFKGRQTPITPKSKERLCARSEVIDDLNDCDVTYPGGIICMKKDRENGTHIKCPNFDHCPYVEQYKSAQFSEFAVEDIGRTVYLKAHQHLHTPRNLLESEYCPTASTSIIDEDFIRGSQNQKKYLLKNLSKHPDLIIRKMARLLKRGAGPEFIGQMLAEDANLKETLKDTVNDYQALRPPVLPDVDDKKLEGVMKEFTKQHQGRGDVIHLYRVLWNTVKAGAERCNGIWVVEHENGTPYVHCCWLDPVVRTSGRRSRALFLDATADPAIMERVIPDLECVRVDIERNAKVIQVFDTPLSKTRFSNNPDLPAEIAYFIKWAFPGKKTSLCTLQAVEKEINKLLPDLPTLHYNKLRGQNSLEDCEVGVIAGTMLPPADAIERYARALEPTGYLQLSEAYTRRHVGYRMRDGSRRSVKTWVHSDPLVNRILAQHRESEIEQAIDRSRLIYNEEEKLIILMTSVPVNVTVDRLVELRDLLGPRGFYLLLEKAGGVLPLHGPVLAKWNPEKWKTIKAASDWVRRNRTWLTEKAISEARPKLIKYQLTGPRSSKLIAVSGLPDLKKAAEILAEFYPDQELKSVLWLE